MYKIASNKMGHQEVEESKKDKNLRDCVKAKQMENAWKETNRIDREQSLKLERCMVKDLIGRSGSDYKPRCSMNEGITEARDSVARQSVDITTDVTRLSVECKEQDVRKNKDMT